MSTRTDQGTSGPDLGKFLPHGTRHICAHFTWREASDEFSQQSLTVACAMHLQKKPLECEPLYPVQRRSIL